MEIKAYLKRRENFVDTSQQNTEFWVAHNFSKTRWMSLQIVESDIKLLSFQETKAGICQLL